MRSVVGCFAGQVLHTDVKPALLRLLVTRHSSSSLRALLYVRESVRRGCATREEERASAEGRRLGEGVAARSLDRSPARERELACNGMFNSNPQFSQPGAAARQIQNT